MKALAHFLFSLFKHLMLDSDDEYPFSQVASFFLQANLLLSALISSRCHHSTDF